MHTISRRKAMAGLLALSGLTYLALAPTQASTVAEPLAQAAAAPRFVYATGAQGAGFYPAQTAPRTSRPAANNRTVGPGVRNWTTGRRSPCTAPGSVRRTEVIAKRDTSYISDIIF